MWADPESDPDSSIAGPDRPFPQQPDLNFETLFAIGAVAYGAGDPGEVEATSAAVRAAMAAAGPAGIPGYQPYVDAFSALGAGVRAGADAQRALGHTAAARDGYLRAAMYYNCALFFVLGTTNPAGEAAAYATMQDCWAAAAALLEPAFERVEIPASVRFLAPGGQPARRDITIPAYWVRAPGEGPKPTVIINNGSDAQLIDVYTYGAATAVERGYNAIIFEGPGQGSLIFEQNIPFTPYWGDVITPIVDFLVGQPEVNPDAIALTGWSLGGLLVVRAAAAEPRIKALVSDPGTTSNSVMWSALTNALQENTGGITNEGFQGLYSHIPEHGVEGRQSLKFTVNKRGSIYDPGFHNIATSGGVITDIVGLLDIVAAYNMSAELIGEVTAHTLVTSYEGDQFVTSADGAALYNALTSAASRTQFEFTRAQGGEYHCAPLAPRFRNQVVFDWLDSVLVPS